MSTLLNAVCVLQIKARLGEDIFNGVVLKTAIILVKAIVHGGAHRDHFAHFPINWVRERVKQGLLGELGQFWTDEASFPCLIKCRKARRWEGSCWVPLGSHWWGWRVDRYAWL